jgi:hypothetical protein
VNYFNYFTEIEEHFQRRRGSLLMLSTLDWALIETWREAGIPLEAVLRGIDAAFDKREEREAHPHRRKQKAVNGLAWCSQAVVEQAQAMLEASVGAEKDSAVTPKDDSFASERIAAHLASCAAAYDSVDGPEFHEAADRLRSLSVTITAPEFRVEELERALTMLEEKIFAALLTRTPDDELVAIREQSSRELAPYKRKMQSAQIAQVERQFLNKRLLESRKLPRLSLFYMAQN